MTRRHILTLACLLAIVSSARFASAQTTINGKDLALRSSGSISGNTNWAFTNDGYLGTYVTLAAPGDVTISVNASGTAASGVAPRMNIAIDDSKAGFDVAS